MNKTELLNKADELIAKANELKELANKEDDIILVPDNIKITQSMRWYSMWLENQNKELLYNYLYQDWGISSWFDTDQLIKCKLTPCKYEDLEPWDLFYRSNLKDSDFGHLYQYALKLDDWSYQYWDDQHCRNGNGTYRHYWKVEPFHLNVNKQ